MSAESFAQNVLYLALKKKKLRNNKTNKTFLLSTSKVISVHTEHHNIEALLLSTTKVTSVHNQHHGNKASLKSTTKVISVQSSYPGFAIISLLHDLSLAVTGGGGVLTYLAERRCAALMGRFFTRNP